MEESERAVLSGLRGMLEGFGTVIHDMDRWFDESGLNFPEKA